MKKNFLILIAFLVMLSFVGCTKKEHNYQSNNQGQKIIVQEVVPNVGENLNLQAVGEIIKTSKNPQEIEERLNQKDGVNNLDLDADGNMDYLSVTEYGEGSTHGYSITANLSDNSKPEVVDIQVDASTKEITISGNQEYYGNTNTYHSTFSGTDFLLLAWLMQPHSYYHSPYYYGHYGYGYSPRPIVTYGSYNSRPIVTTSRTTTYKNVPRSQTSKIQSPNANNKSAVATRTTNLSKPTQSQKQFKVNTNTGKSTQVNGFGNKTKNTAPQSNSNSKSNYTSKSSSSKSSYTPSKSSSSRSSSSRSSSSRSSSSRSSSSRSSRH